jgi:hypothetical protein
MLISAYMNSEYFMRLALAEAKEGDALSRVRVLCKSCKLRF